MFLTNDQIVTLRARADAITALLGCDHYATAANAWLTIVPYLGTSWLYHGAGGLGLVRLLCLHHGSVITPSVECSVLPPDFQSDSAEAIGFAMSIHLH